MARKGKKQTAPVNDGPYYVMSDSDQTPTMHYIYYEGKGDMNYAPSESYDEIASDVAYLNEAYKRDEMRNSDQGNEGKTVASNGTTLYKAIISKGNAYGVENDHYIVYPVSDQGIDGVEVYNKDTHTMTFTPYRLSDQSWLDTVKSVTNGGRGKWHVRNN